jgi:hypothetical protein
MFALNQDHISFLIVRIHFNRRILTFSEMLVVTNKKSYHGFTISF